jgi:hypothetical protein
MVSVFQAFFARPVWASVAMKAKRLLATILKITQGVKDTGMLTAGTPPRKEHYGGIIQAGPMRLWPGDPAPGLAW